MNRDRQVGSLAKLRRIAMQHKRGTRTIKGQTIEQWRAWVKEELAPPQPPNRHPSVQYVLEAFIEALDLLEEAKP